MKIVSFNVNSVRMRLQQLARVIDKHAPEFIGLQETKVQDHEFPLAEIEALGYEVIFMGQKTHYGVALLSKSTCRNAYYGLPNDGEEAQKRFIGGDFKVDGKLMSVFNGYFPQGESRDHPLKFPAKILFYKELNEFLRSFDMNKTPLIVMGDYNIAPQDIDIGIGEDNAKRWLRTGKTSFLPEERDTMVFDCAMRRKTIYLAGLITAAKVSSANQSGVCESTTCWYRKTCDPPWLMPGLTMKSERCKNRQTMHQPG